MGPTKSKETLVNEVSPTFSLEKSRDLEES